jgi:hypothetical protein
MDDSPGLGCADADPQRTNVSTNVVEFGGEMSRQEATYPAVVSAGSAFYAEECGGGVEQSG